MDLRVENVQQQTLNAQMFQSMGILQMNAAELEAYIENLSIENPVVDLVSETEKGSDDSHDNLYRKLEWLESTDYQNKVYYQSDRSAQDYLSLIHI